ncbi:MAG: hypothetical protein QOD32_3126 [Pyrinomonadaceae bacterium]|jgi:hypothetical protein|nr:hypothetical protein [Pyrinomonadaceae bacterium]
MGGISSTRWNFQSTRGRVESCLTIGAPRGVVQDASGAWFWQRYGWRVSYNLVADDNPCLHLQFNHGLEVKQAIKLDRTPLNYGGVRWWFICPECSRRVAHLHLPSRAFYFRCRHCYRLTYESAQTSRSRSASFFRLVANNLQGNSREARLWVRAHYDGVVHEVKRPKLEARERRIGLRRVIVRIAQKKGFSV